MSRGYAEFSREKNQESGTGNFAAEVDDLSRVVLFLILVLAALAGYFYTSYYNKPANVLKSSISKTLKSPFKASIEGKTVLQDSVIAVYRKRESYIPKQGATAEPSSETVPPPFSVLEALDMVRNATRADELDREDMFGHPTRHFYGELNSGTIEPGRPSGYYFEYWADMKNLGAVRLILTGVCRNMAVSARGDSVSAETTVNIRFY
ncbi:MAG: hypothetical protein ACYC9O_09665 [Candidatus Latescibacterota bacterium]